jgi:integrase/recombinase XerC
MARKYIQYVTEEKLQAVNPQNKELVRRYFVFKNMNLSDSSKKSYESDFNQWLCFIADRYDNQYILEFDTDEAVDMLEDFIAFCTSVLGNNERRIQRRLSSISSFYLYLRKKRKIKENPVDFLERPRLGKGEKPQIKQTFLTKEQIEEIRKGLKKLDDTQLELFFELGLSTMARVNALCNIKVEQIDFKNSRIENVVEKEGYVVTLFPSKRAMELIQKWIKEREAKGIQSEYLFVTKYNGEWKQVNKATMQTSWIKKIGNIIGIPDLHCHDLRHTGSTLLYKAGMPLETVSKLLHHRSTQTTLDHYIQTDFDKLQDEKSKFEI